MRPSPCSSAVWLLLGVACSARAPDVRPVGPVDGGVAPTVTRAVQPSARQVGVSRRLLEVARAHAELDDLSLYLRARVADARGDAAAVDDATAALDQRWPESIWRGPALLLRGRVRRRTGDLAGAAADAARARDAMGPGDGRAAAGLLLAEIAAEKGDAVTAVALAREVREARPRGLAARRARRLVDRLRGGVPPEDVGERLAEAELRLAEGDAAGALREADAVAAGGGDRRRREQARWVRARAERALGHRQAAESTALALAQDGGPTYGPKALAAVAGWRWNADDDGGALELFSELLRRWPDSEEASEALYAVGRIRQEAGQHEAAYEAYTTLAQRFPMARTVDEARWRAGWVRYLAGDPAGAATVFAELSSDCGPRTRVAAEYWEARALEQVDGIAARDKLGHVADQHAATYYGTLARARLGLGEPSVETDDLQPWRPAFPPTLAGLHAARARVLHAAGFRRLARRELDAIGDAAPAEVLLQAYAAIGSPGSVIRVARAREADRQWLYPLGYWQVVRPYADAHDLDPLLVMALIRQESLFFPDAVSPADARGLMQLLPRTAREVAPAAGVPAPDTRALHRPATNVALGTTLLRRLLDQYGGSRVKALAAYNAGEEAVAKWERRYGERPEDEFVELITYRETRDYVKNVLEHYAVYRDIYAGKASATSFGSPPNAPLDMMTMTSPARADATR